MMKYSTETERLAPEALFSAVEEQLAVGRGASFTVTGMSMWPFICHGRDQVVVTACDPASLRIGDIVLFQTPLGNYMLHRITGLRADAFETTGDGNCFRDGWFSRECVRARVVSICRAGKTIDCDARCWRFAFRVWAFLFPIRGGLLRLLRRVGRWKARVRKWRNRSANRN